MALRAKPSPGLTRASTCTPCSLGDHRSNLATTFLLPGQGTQAPCDLT